MVLVWQSGLFLTREGFKQRSNKIWFIFEQDHCGCSGEKSLKAGKGERMQGRSWEVTSTIPDRSGGGEEAGRFCQWLEGWPKRCKRKTAKEDSYVSVLSSREGCSCQKTEMRKMIGEDCENKIRASVSAMWGQMLKWNVKQVVGRKSGVEGRSGWRWNLGVINV